MKRTDLLASTVFFIVLALCMGLATSYDDGKSDFEQSCHEKNGIALTPSPGQGPWVCLKKEGIIE